MAVKKVQAPEKREAPLSIRIKPSVREAMTKAATAEQRSVSQLAEIILGGWLKEKGFIK